MAKLLFPQKSSWTTNMSTFITIIFLAITIFPLYHTSEAAMCKKMSQPPAQKPKLVLVHGFASGGYSWFKVRFILESFGYSVTAIDLKASGIDLTDVSTIDTFEQYNEPLDQFMTSLPQHEKVVLVGHSAGGVSLTKVLHDHPHKVYVAVYVSGTMLKFNYLTCEDLQIGVPHFSESKCNASCPKLPEPTCFEKTLKQERPVVGESEDYTLARILARPGPYRAMLTSKIPEAAAATNTSGSIDDVPRVYVKTRYDRTLKPEQQDAMISRWPPCEVIEINNDHDVPYDKPELLASLIVNATCYASPNMCQSNLPADACLGHL